MFKDVADVLWDASQANGFTPYMQGSLTDTVYACYGAMEDWGYGAGWDTTQGSQQSTCNPDTKLPFKMNDYLNDMDTIRTAIYLVEASNQKSPPDNSYGMDTDVLNSKAMTDGYVPRNIRLMLAFVDMIQPYILFEDPVVTPERVTLKWKLYGCITIQNMTIWVKKNGKYTKTNKLQEGAGFYCNHHSFKRQSEFIHNIDMDTSVDSETEFKIEYLADQNWAKQNSPRPDVPP